MEDEDDTDVVEVEMEDEEESVDSSDDEVEMLCAVEIPHTISEITLEEVEETLPLNGNTALPESALDTEILEIIPESKSEFSIKNLFSFKKEQNA